jgi:hypothetical protein
VIAELDCRRWARSCFVSLAKYEKMRQEGSFRSELLRKFGWRYLVGTSQIASPGER